jgi:hypothetical protein
VYNHRGLFLPRSQKVQRMYSCVCIYGVDRASIVCYMVLSSAESSRMYIWCVRFCRSSIIDSSNAKGKVLNSKQFMRLSSGFPESDPAFPSKSGS